MGHDFVCLECGKYTRTGTPGAVKRVIKVDESLDIEYEFCSLECLMTFFEVIKRGGGA